MLVYRTQKWVDFRCVINSLYTEHNDFSLECLSLLATWCYDCEKEKRAFFKNSPNMWLLASCPLCHQVVSLMLTAERRKFLLRFSLPQLKPVSCPSCSYFKCLLCCWILFSNPRDDHGFSPLHWACREGRSSVVDMLIMRGARINVMNRGDDTPLHLAASHGHRDIVGKVGFIGLHIKMILNPLT